MNAPDILEKVDSGEYLRIGEVETPWPCFCICVSEKAQADQKKMSAIEKFLHAVRERAISFKLNEGDSTIQYLMTEYNMHRDDAQAWLESVQWEANPGVSRSMLMNVCTTLKELDIIKDDVGIENIVTSKTTVI